jgi:hypothetical protein
MRRTSSNLNLCRLHVSVELLLVSDASLLQNVPGHGSTPNLAFANAFFRHLPCHRPTSSPYLHNATTTTSSGPRSVQNTEDCVYGRGRPVRLSLSHRASPPEERSSAAPRLSCHVRAPEAQLSILSILMAFADSLPEIESLY